MIQLVKGELNTIITRLEDWNYYRFEFKSIQSGEIVKCIPENQSTINNYNKFQIRELSDSLIPDNPTASIPDINLKYSGSWEYKVFGLTQSDLDLEGVILDRGIMNLKGPETESFFFDDEVLNIPIFFDIEDFYEFSGGDDDVYGVFEEYISNWILRNGFWRDAGEWIDTAFWKD